MASIASFLREKNYSVALRKFDENFLNYDEIMEIHPDIIGIPIYDVNRNKVFDFCSRLKSLLPDAVICAGGAFPTIYGQEILMECDSIDVVVKGEGEEAYLDLLSMLDKREKWHTIRGIQYRQNNKIIETQGRPLIRNMDQLPLPSRDLLIQNNIKIAQISTSRGCTACCSFCTSRLLWSRWRGRSMERTLDEIYHLTSSMGIRAYNIIDGSFEDPGFNSNRMRQFAEGLLNRKINISYYIHMRAESYKEMTPDLICLLKKSGLSSICIGLESGNEEDLSLYHKRAAKRDIIKAVEYFSGYGIFIDPGFINFNPYSTIEGLKQNISFLEKYGYAANPDYILKKSKIYKGTAMYSLIERDALLSESLGDFCFLNDDIHRLYEYASTIMRQKMKSRMSVFDYVRNGVSISRVYTSCLKTLFQNAHLTEALQIVSEYEDSVADISYDLNQRFSSWFKSLLYIAVQGWNVVQADIITNTYIVPSEMVQASVQLTYLAEKMKKSLKKLELHEDYISLLNYCF